jgi:hypothetical protein
MDVLAQNTAVLRYAARFILTKRAQKKASFSGIGVYVLAHLYLIAVLTVIVFGLRLSSPRFRAGPSAPTSSILLSPAFTSV